MKTLFLLLTILQTFLGTLTEDMAQAGLKRDLALVFPQAPHNFRAEAAADESMLRGEYRMYPTDQPSPTRAPKGYKPFYISHFGRHGARFANGDMYETLLSLLQKAHDEGKLTAAGEDLHKRYAAFYPRVANRSGYLTRKGQEQHRYIASRMFKDYPEVFKGKTRAEAISTESHRVLLSMTAFLDQMSEMDRDFTWEADYGRVYLPVLEPSKDISPAFVPRKPYTPSVTRKRDCFNEARIDKDLIARRFFNDPDWLSETYGRGKFIKHIWTVGLDIPCMDDPGPDDFSDLLTESEKYHLWQVRNYNGYLFFGNAPGTDKQSFKEMAGTVADFIQKAEADWADGTALRLRFSHDTGMMPLLSYLGVNGFDASIDDPYQVENWWRSSDVPMAGNLQLVFFRSRSNPEILVKVLLNGFEASLPFPSADGPFYRWTDFKSFYADRQAAEAPRK